MIRCPHCDENNTDGSKFCMNCGSSISELSFKPKSEIAAMRRNRPYETYDPLYRLSAPSTSLYFRQQSPLNPLAYICSCCVPIVGFVIYLAIKDDRPKEAPTILILSILSFAFAFIFGTIG